MKITHLFYILASLFMLSCAAANGTSPRCFERPKYFIVQREHSNDIGAHFLVKYKRSPTQSVLCAYTVDQNDFEIDEVENDYIAEINDLLFLSGSTGPTGNGLSVWSLQTREKVYHVVYEEPLEL